MIDQNNARRNSRSPAGFWRSRAGVALVAFAAIAFLLLGYEHRVHLIGGNGLLLVLLAMCVGMHFFMHGGRGGHGGDH